MLSKNFFKAIKQIILFVFIIHFSWFFIFLLKKMWANDIGLPNLKQKLLILFAIAFSLILIYRLLLRRILIVNKIVKIFTNIFLLFYLYSIVLLFYCSVFNPPFTLTQLSSLLQGNGLKKEYVPFNEISPYMKLAVIASEDQLFLDHDGFDLKSIKLAIKYNQKHPNKIRGASTISQQVSKNVFLWQGGGFIRKGPEIFYTFCIEKFWNKKIILERYLNIAEMGKGVFGIQAAAKTYFNKDAKGLTKVEAAQIAACLPNPKKFTVKPLSKYVANRYDDILKQMNFLEADPDVKAFIK